MMTKAVLEQIVELSGDCLDSTRCKDCPFKNKCLVEFGSKKPPSKKMRLITAIDKITVDALLNEDMEWREGVN